MSRSVVGVVRHLSTIVITPPNTMDNPGDGYPPCRARRCNGRWAELVSQIGDAVPDGDLFRADEDVLDAQALDSQAFSAGGLRAGAGPGEEAFQVLGELEVGVAVGELSVRGAELAARAGLGGCRSGIRARMGTCRLRRFHQWQAGR
jgi:hypothetical protein